jgi:hypothetical protein
VLIRGGLRFWRPSKPKVRLAEFKSRHVSAGRILWRPNIWDRTLLVPLDVGFTTTQLRSGARDLNPGPHGPEPCVPRVLACPDVSSSVPLYSSPLAVMSSRVLPCPLRFKESSQHL